MEPDKILVALVGCILLCAMCLLLNQITLAGVFGGAVVGILIPAGRGSNDQITA